MLYIYTGWFARVWLKVAGLFAGIKCTGFTLATWGILLVPQYTPVTLAHELVHVAQLQRDGGIRMRVRYLWYSLTRGYENNPYEIEAYRRQTEKEFMTQARTIQARSK